MFSTVDAALLAQAEPNAMTFGVLGPVGLVAIALGVVGMTAGVLRQRKRAVAKAQARLQANTQPSGTNAS